MGQRPVDQMFPHFADQKQTAQRDNRCVECGEVITFTYTPSKKPGNIYSEAGKREYRISGCCEFCFDNMFGEE